MTNSPNEEDKVLGGSSAGEPDVGQENGGLNATVATVVVVAAGAALFEAALLPGIALGGPPATKQKNFPKLAAAFNPLFKSAVRGTYKFAKKSREALAEAHEQVNAVIAEVKAETEAQAREAAAKDRNAA